MIVLMPAVVAVQGGGAVLDGVLERVTFANPETGYTIARIAPERGADLVTAVGPLLGAQIGEFLRLRGRWSSHPKYGRQFEVASYATVLPATAAGIQKYLGSGLIRGIGPAPWPRPPPTAPATRPPPTSPPPPPRSSTTPPSGSPPAWTGGPPRTGAYARRCPRRPGPGRLRPHRRSPPSTCRRSIRPNGP